MPTTPTSTSSCSKSAPSIDWRPSKYVVYAIGAFGPLGAISLLASDLPAAIAWPASVVAVALAWRAAAREARRPPVTVTFPPNAPPALDGHRLRQSRLQWRGPLAFLQWRDGRLQGLSWWPDTLPPAARRELRLATGASVTARDGGSVAP